MVAKNSYAEEVVVMGKMIRSEAEITVYIFIMLPGIINHLMVKENNDQFGVL